MCIGKHMMMEGLRWTVCEKYCQGGVSDRDGSIAFSYIDGTGTV